MPPLTRFQRVLLATEGTVTDLLAAYAGEPIEVVKLQQHIDVADGAGAELCLSGDEMVLRRRVLLRGSHTRHTLLYAEAAVVLDRVPRAFTAALDETDEPIGLLLRENRLETLREILLVDREPAGPRAADFGIEPTDELILRRYRIVARGKPIVLVTEKFPTASFPDLPASARRS